MNAQHSANTGTNAPIWIRATRGAELITQLDAAVDIMLATAITGGQYGVLVSRHDYATFSVEISADVPYGITREREAPIPASMTTPEKITDKEMYASPSGTVQ